MSFSSKILVITLVLSFTLGYSLFEKRKFNAMLSSGDSEPILKKMPELELLEFSNKEMIPREVFTRFDATFVHLWATWCAPCEAEFPDFLAFARRFEDQKVKFLLVAIRDDNKKIKKFLKRFGKLPSNVILSHDESGKVMNDFGTVKVPETYLFNGKLESIKKFAGPQAWGINSFYPRIKRLIFGH